MRWLWLSVLLALFVAEPAVGQNATPVIPLIGGTPVSSGNPLPISGGSSGGVLDQHSTAVAPTYVEGTDNPLSGDLSGNLRVTNTTATPAGGAIIGKIGIDQTTPGTTNNVTTQGIVADAATASGNPVPSGAIYQSTLPTYTDGQRSTLHTGTRGSLRTELWNSDSTVTQGFLAAGADGGTNSTPGLVDYARRQDFNGSTWDRTFTCSNSAVINVTAGNTTELVALTAAQTIRVCSFVLTESLAGTAQFVYGTGTNCGTGTTNLTGAMTIATNSALNISSGQGSLFRTASANALCLAAVTGNLTGFVTYAKY